MKHLSEPIAYGVDDAAAQLQISRRKLYDLIEQGRIVSFKIGKARRISRAAIETFVSQMEEEAA